MPPKLYGIANCDTVRKARHWLDEHGIEYAFHDYKKAGVDEDRLASWIEQAGLDRVLNKSGTTYRKLSHETKAQMNGGGAVAVMAAQPSMIKRPIVEYADGLLIGFKPDEWGKAITVDKKGS